MVSPPSITSSPAFSENKIVVLIVPDEQYTQKVLSLAKDLSTGMGSILYISLNRPYVSVISSFSSLGINPEKFYFVDAVTQTAQKGDGSSDKVKYVSSPGSLTELSLTLSKLLDNQKFDFVFFDSLSTLLVYEEETVVTRFIHSLVSKIRVVGCKGIFTCLKRDMDSIVIKDLNMFADRILDIEAWGSLR